MLRFHSMGDDHGSCATHTLRRLVLTTDHEDLPVHTCE
jgi:hypothetical protein